MERTDGLHGAYRVLDQLGKWRAKVVDTNLGLLGVWRSSRSYMHGRMAEFCYAA